MRKLKLLLIFTLIILLLFGCKSKEARVQEQLDLGSKYMAELDYESATLEKVLELDDLSSDNEDEINNRIKNLDFLVAISKLPGEYDEPTALELSNIGSNDIYYSIDTKDSRLLATDMKYTTPILLDDDGSYIVKAYTVDSSGNKHDSTEVKYTIKLSKEHSEKDSWESIGNIYRYRGKDGKIVTGWQQIDGSWYYFKENGDMETGLVDINGVKYCFDEDGVMLTGWQQINDKWYYLGDDGIAKSGSQSIDGKQYYFGDDGAMLTGWQQIDGKWYYISDSGELSTGWQQIDGKWYYFASNGEMKTDQYIDGYYVGADGVRVAQSNNNITASSENTDYKKLYRDVLTKLYTKHELEERDDYNDVIGESMESGEAQYTLLDVTGDGKAELIIYVKPGISSIYGVKDGKISLLLGTGIDSGCVILNDNSIVYSFASHNAEIGGCDFWWYKYNNSTGKFEEYRSGLAAENINYEGYDEEETKLYKNLMKNVKYGIWEVANIPVTPENIATIK